MSIESDAKKWLGNVSRIRELDPQGVLLSNASEYFKGVAAVFENKDFNPEDTKKKLGALRGRLTRLTGKPVAVELGSFINITARYATKTQADFDGFVRALYAPEPSPRPVPVSSAPRPSPRPSSSGSSPRPSPRPSPAGSSPRPSPTGSSWFDAFASTGNIPPHEPRSHTAENPFAEDEKEEHSTALRVIGVIILLLLVIFLIYTSTGFGKDTMTDSRDGKIYKTVQIGSQTWMAENLNYDYNVGTARSYCYDNSWANCDKFGRLYTWSAAMDSAAVFSTGGIGCGSERECSGSKRQVRGVCPAGWHLPIDFEWNELKNFVANSRFGGYTDSVGYALKSASGWKYDKGLFGYGSDEFGFGALPAGGRGRDETFGNFFDYTIFWSSVERGKLLASVHYLRYNYTNLFTGGGYKYGAMSVRCVKDYF